LHSVLLLADIADGARVTVTRVQHYGGRTDALLREYASVGRDATYTSNVIQLGGANVRAEAHLTLAQPGASAFLRGAYLATGRQRFDFLTHQNHQAPHATSNLLYKGALLGRARASYQGMITVAPDAQRTDAYQSNRTLVLSGDARADSSPQLEIGANDVRCTHGSTVSNVSETELFYMQSRGIPREVARRLLVSAFIAEVTDQVGNQRVTDLVEKYVAELNA
jgi:Fe-S cluster assembly protein SufD